LQLCCSSVAALLQLCCSCCMGARQPSTRGCSVVDCAQLRAFGAALLQLCCSCCMLCCSCCMRVVQLRAVGVDRKRAASQVAGPHLSQNGLRQCLCFCTRSCVRICAALLANLVNLVRDARPAASMHVSICAFVLAILANLVRDARPAASMHATAAARFPSCPCPCSCSSSSSSAFALPISMRASENKLAKLAQETGG
jgi:hypothetical protein